jgi:hypothetical protein
MCSNVKIATRKKRTEKDKKLRRRNRMKKYMKCLLGKLFCQNIYKK